MKRILIVSLLISIFLIGCSIPGRRGPEEAPSELAHKGTQGIEFTFLPDYPPSVIYTPGSGDTGNSIVLEVKNKGAFTTGAIFYLSGYDNIDVAACNKAGIIVVNVPSYCEEEVSDTAVAMSYALSRKLLFYNSNLKAGKWDWKPGVPIHRFNTLKVGLIGFGGIAKATTRKFKSLGLEVFVTDPYIPDEIFLKNGVKKVRLDTLLRECDIISVHVPLTESTRHLIGEKEFGMMKETAIIINTSRGPVIDEKALIDALQNGKIGGAGLDVFEKEPLSPDSPLLQMNNVIVTPHCGWYSEESKIDIRVKLAKDIARVLNGKEPFGFVNKKHIVR